jgi:hypothetical protein
MLSAARSDYIVPTDRGRQSATLIDRIDSADPAGMISMQLPVSKGQEREAAFSLGERGGATSSCGRSDEHRCASRPSPQFDFSGRGMDERFNVREAICKDGEPTTKMTRAIPQPRTVFIYQKRNPVEYVVPHLDMILDQDRIVKFE